MAKLYFNYSTMNAGKSTLLLQASHNYKERGMQTYLLTAQMDTRAGQGKIASRIGIGWTGGLWACTAHLAALRVIEAAKLFAGGGRRGCTNSARLGL